MNLMKQQTLFRLSCISLTLALGMLMPACGGGGSDSGGGMTNPLTARFTSDAPDPLVADTISMAGTTAGANVAIEVQVTSINDFFGAGFRVTYDSSVFNFTGFDATGSLIDDYAGGTDIDADEISPGTIAVVATIQDASQPAGIDVAGTRKLITLNFQATTTTGDTPIDFADPSDVQLCPTQGQACNEVSGSLDWYGGSIRASR
jgi:hypothetical protein